MPLIHAVSDVCPAFLPPEVVPGLRAVPRTDRPRSRADHIPNIDALRRGKNAGLLPDARPR